MPDNHVNLPNQPGGRPFPWVCPNCRSREVRLAKIAYRAEQLFQGKLIAVDIPQLEIPQCGKCGELVFNYTADEQILAAVKAKAANFRGALVSAANDSSKQICAEALPG